MSVSCFPSFKQNACKDNIRKTISLNKDSLGRFRKVLARVSFLGFKQPLLDNVMVDTSKEEGGTLVFLKSNKRIFGVQKFSH